jgi:hypothetical protein
MGSCISKLDSNVQWQKMLSRFKAKHTQSYQSKEEGRNKTGTLMLFCMTSQPGVKSLAMFFFPSRTSKRLFVHY